jgi:integrase
MARTSQGVRKTQARPTGDYPADYWPTSPEEVADIPFIGEAFDTYMKEASGHRRSMKTSGNIVAAFNQFLTAAHLHEHMTLDEITKATGRTWIEYMRTPRKFPSRAVAKAATIDAKIKQVRHFLQFCVSQDWIESNAFANLALPAPVVSASRVRKTAFTDEELALIFKSLQQFQHPSARFEVTRPKRIEFYYCVLLLAFTGARAMEVIQLNKADVRQIDGVWVVDICEGLGKSLKNRPSIRKVPIHSQLLPVFLPWFQLQTGSKLFPLLHEDTSQNTSRWFSSYVLKRTGIKRPEVSLHSLRHSMTHRLIGAYTNPALQNRLLGHVIVKGVEARYAAGFEFPVKELQAAIELVKFPML